MVVYPLGDKEGKGEAKDDKIGMIFIGGDGAGPFMPIWQLIMFESIHKFSLTYGAER